MKPKNQHRYLLSLIHPFKPSAKPSPPIPSRRLMEIRRKILKGLLARLGKTGETA